MIRTNSDIFGQKCFLSFSFKLFGEVEISHGHESWENVGHIFREHCHRDSAQPRRQRGHRKSERWDAVRCWEKMYFFRSILGWYTWWYCSFKDLHRYIFWNKLAMPHATWQYSVPLNSSKSVYDCLCVSCMLHSIFMITSLYASRLVCVCAADGFQCCYFYLFRSFRFSATCYHWY